MVEMDGWRDGARVRRQRERGKEREREGGEEVTEVKKKIIGIYGWVEGR